MPSMWIVRSPVLVVLALALLASSGCRRLPRVFRTKQHRTATAPRRLPPLPGAQTIQSLALPSFEAALVAVPVGASISRPVVVALHGQSDSARANCEAWRTITEGSYFVLCPELRRKVSAADSVSESCTRWDCAADELKEALVALRRRFGAYVAPKQVMLAGFGRGAALAVPIAQQNPQVFPILWLIDGGFDSWSNSLSATFVERGGKLLGLACTGAACQSEVIRIIASANAVGLRTVDYRRARGEGEWSPGLAISLKAAWESARPKQWPWALTSVHDATSATSASSPPEPHPERQVR